MDLTQKKIVIVGGSDGIGQAVAAELARGNNEIAIIARNQKSLDETAQIIARHGSRAIVKVADALDTQLAVKTVAELKAQMGRIDLALLNVGGASDVLEIATGTADEANLAMRLNFDTMTNYLFPIAQVMKNQPDGGVIAHTNSLAGFLGMPLAMHYNAGKAATRIFLDGARIELEKYNIRILNICPGFVETRLQEKNPLPKPFLMSAEEAAQEFMKAMREEIPEHLFPWQMALGTNLGRVQPKWILSKFFGFAAKQ